MIGEIIKLVQADEWRGVSQRVEIAKGENQYITNFNQLKLQFKRLRKWPKK